MKAVTGILILGCLFAASWPASAEKADRDKPVNLEADRITVDDAKKVHILEGKVQLVQGTLIIRSEKLVVTQDAEGFQSGVATGGEGGLARFRQKREGKDEYIEGEAERIEYNGKSEKAQFFLRAHVASGQDEVRGQYISYDGKSESYLVTSGPGGTIAPPIPGKDSRVRAVIQPKQSSATGKPGDAKSILETPPLKAAPEINNPRQE